jgi:hypothetical protein
MMNGTGRVLCLDARLKDWSVSFASVRVRVNSLSGCTWHLLGTFVDILSELLADLPSLRAVVVGAGDLKYKGNHSLPPKDQMITAEPDVTVTTLTDEDEFIILACDGIWDCKTNQVTASSAH